jgi:hypothetical protein
VIHCRESMPQEGAHRKSEYVWAQSNRGDAGYPTPNDTSWSS